MPEIWYEFEDKRRRYYPDIYIKSQNKIIEVKSDYTFHKDYNKNLAKAQGVLALDYDFEFRIYDAKGDYTIPELEFTI